MHATLVNGLILPAVSLSCLTFFVKGGQGPFWTPAKLIRPSSQATKGLVNGALSVGCKMRVMMESARRPNTFMTHRMRH